MSGMDGQKPNKPRIHMMLLGYVGDIFLKQLRQDNDFETNGVSVTVVERENHIVQLWNIANSFTDYFLIKKLFKKVQVLIYGVDLSGENAFRYIDVIRADNAMNAVYIFMFYAENLLSDYEKERLTVLREKYDFMSTYFDKNDSGSSLKVLDACIAEYERVMSQKYRDFALKLFRM